MKRTRVGTGWDSLPVVLRNTIIDWLTLTDLNSLLFVSRGMLDDMIRLATTARHVQIQVSDAANLDFYKVLATHCRSMQSMGIKGPISNIWLSRFIVKHRHSLLDIMDERGFAISVPGISMLDKAIRMCHKLEYLYSGMMKVADTNESLGRAWPNITSVDMRHISGIELQSILGFRKLSELRLGMWGGNVAELFSHWPEELKTLSLQITDDKDEKLYHGLSQATTGQFRNLVKLTLDVGQPQRYPKANLAWEMPSLEHLCYKGCLLNGSIEFDAPQLLYIKWDSDDEGFWPTVARSPHLETIILRGRMAPVVRPLHDVPWTSLRKLDVNPCVPFSFVMAVAKKNPQLVYVSVHLAAWSLPTCDDVTTFCSLLPQAEEIEMQFNPRDVVASKTITTQKGTHVPIRMNRLLEWNVPTCFIDDSWLDQFYCPLLASLVISEAFPRVNLARWLPRQTRLDSLLLDTNLHHVTPPLADLSLHTLRFGDCFLDAEMLISWTDKCPKLRVLEIEKSFNGVFDAIGMMTCPTLRELTISLWGQPAASSRVFRHTIRALPNLEKLVVHSIDADWATMLDGLPTSPHHGKRLELVNSNNSMIRYIEREKPRRDWTLS